MKDRAVGIVGAGNVGMAGAFAMLAKRVCMDMVLVDLNEKRARGEALDLMHGQGLVGRARIRAGTFSDLETCPVVVITAGASQKPGETRIELLHRNYQVLSAIARELDTHCPDAVCVVASNPVDILTHMLQELSERPKEKVFGTGTMLDTTRFRSLLGQHYDVNPRSIHGYILAEHGDSEFAAWSTVTIGGRPILNNEILGKPYDRGELEALFGRVRGAAYEIIEGKGYTNWAIGLVIAELVSILLNDLKSVQPISVRLDGEYGLRDVCISVPARIGRHGVEDVVELDLIEEERMQLEHSAQLLKEVRAPLSRLEGGDGHG
jgi:L-lactate dehydrogenase